MTAPVPEESNEALDVTEPTADEHDSDLPDEQDVRATPVAEENAHTSLDQPSDG